MGKSGFKMRSGNSSSFKMMGSSPVKDDTKDKMWIAKNYEKYKDKPGFQEYVDKKFGGKTTFDGMVSTTTKTKKATRKEAAKKSSPADMNWGKIGKAALGPAGLLL